MSEVTPVLSAEPVVEDFQLAADTQEPRLEIGHAFVISSGVLEGATGTVVKRSSSGHYLVSLEVQKDQIWARLPAHLLRTT